jgi:CRISPR/Cas system-associated endonuclease Cas1
MQDRSFDIAGPNPSAEEQKHIDEQYTIYLENQRRSTIAAAFAARQQQQLQAALKSDAPKVPLPQQRPKQAAAPAADMRPRYRGGECARQSFSCDFPRLSDTWNDFKKLLTSSPGKQKKS